MFIQSIQTRMMVPMAISLAFGVLFAACVTLLLVPCLYVILEDLTRLRTRRSGARDVGETPTTELPVAGG